MVLRNSSPRWPWKTKEISSAILLDAVQKTAHVMLAFTAQRVSEVVGVGAQWDELDLETATWSLPRLRMKKKDAAPGPRVIPLPPRLATLSKQWCDRDDGASNFVCPAPRDPAKSITAEACEKHYRDVLGLAGCIRRVRRSRLCAGSLARIST